MRCNIITKDFFEIADASGIKDACHEKTYWRPSSFLSSL